MNSTQPNDSNAAQAATAAQLIASLGMQPHPEGGHYVETWRGPASADGGRAVATAIYFLLQRDERSHWHCVDASELWLYHAGAPLALAIAPTSAREGVDESAGAVVQQVLLGADLAAGQRPQAVVPTDAWQSAATTGDWTLVSCVVAPGFSFDGFELAPPGWEPVSPRP